MKKFIITLLCVAICLTFAACGGKSSVEVPMGLQLASNESIPDYVLMVPDDWTVEESTGTTTAYFKDNLSGAILATFTASFTSADRFATVSTDIKTTEATAEATSAVESSEVSTTTNSVDEDSQNEIILDNYFKDYSDDLCRVFQVDESQIEISSTVLGGEYAKQYIYNAKFDEQEYTFWQVNCVHSNRIYSLTFSTTQTGFEKYAEDMEVILEYFSFS